MTSTPPLPAVAAVGAAAAAAMAFVRRGSRPAPGATVHEARPVAQRWRCARPVRVEAVCGMLWITRHDSPDDHWLAPGDTLDVPAGTTLWIGADPTPCAGDRPVRWRWIDPSCPTRSEPR